MKNSTHQRFDDAARRSIMAMLTLALASTTGATARAAAGPMPVDLGAAAVFAILTKTGITNVPTSAITGDLGASPIASTAITGFSLVADATNTFSTSAPGLYKWSTGVLITTDVTLAGASDAVWIFQIAKNLTPGSGAQVLLSGRATERSRVPRRGVRPAEGVADKPRPGQPQVLALTGPMERTMLAPWAGRQVGDALKPGPVWPPLPVLPGGRVVLRSNGKGCRGLPCLQENR